jgi:hypothetical protein
MRVLEEVNQHATERSMHNVSAVHPTHERGVVRISISLATPLSDEENQMFQEGKLHFKREVNDGDGGSALSLWLAKKSVLLHGGQLGFATTQDGEFLCMDLPFERAASPMLKADLKSFQNNFAGMMLLKLPSSRSLFSTPSMQQRSLSEKNKPRLSLISMGAIKIAPILEAPKRVLIVDDSEMNRKMIIRLMTSLGYDCDEAEDGLKAHTKVVTALQEGVTYEFVLLDNGNEQATVDMFLNYFCS